MFCDPRRTKLRSLGALLITLADNAPALVSVSSIGYENTLIQKLVMLSLAA